MVRFTSLQALHAIRESGTLGQRQIQAYEVLHHHGPLTGNELSSKAGLPGLWKRLSELETKGMIKVVGERPCTVTGRNCVIWDVVSRSESQPDLFEAGA